MNLSTSHSPDSGGVSAGTLHRLSVLVVEDDADLRTEVCERLRHEGYAVAEAGDGQEGLKMLRSAPVDVVLLDLWLPSMDGWSFRAEQRQDARVRDVPVIVMTADNSPQARAIDADAVLQKPFGGDELCAKIGEVLADKGAESKGATERVSQVVALLANAVGHEVANPLMTLISGLERLGEGSATDGHGEAPNAKQLLDQCWRIASSLRTLRALPCPARTRDGDVDLRQVVRSAIARARADNVSITFDGAQSGWVRGDPMVLLYLCTALVQNAVEAVPGPSVKSRPKVEVRLRSSPTEVTLEVCDSGAPIPEDELARIFAVDSPGRERAWGAGLRLWFVRQIVEELGGAIEISNIEQGVRCRVRLSARQF